MATKYVDLVNGNNANDGSSFANRKKTLASAAAVAAAGDTIRVMGKPSYSSGTATWTKGSSTVTLSTALTQEIWSDGAWTAATNVTASAPTSSPSPKEGSNSSQLAANGTFTTGKMGHFQLGAAVNLSSYRQVSFWIRSNAALASGKVSLDLCSDTGGNTAVDTLTLNVALNANQWTAVTIDKGSALGTSINSVRLTAISTMASQTIQIDNVFAAKTAGGGQDLTLNTLISPDNLTWYHIQSVKGTTVKLDGQQATAAGAARNFQGTTGSSTFYMLQPTVISIDTSSSNYNQTFTTNGSAGNQITISGGWDSTAMTTQSGFTAIDLRDWTGSGLNISGATTGYITVDKFVFNHCAIAIGVDTSTAKGLGLTNSTVAGAGSSVLSGTPTHGMNISGSNFLNCAASGYMFDIPANNNYNTDALSWSFSNSKIWGAGAGGIKVPAFVSAPAVSISGVDSSGNNGLGFEINSPCVFNSINANNNASQGVLFQSVIDQVVHGLTAKGNGTAEVQLSGSTLEIFTLDTNNSAATPQIMVVGSAVGKAIVYNWTQYTGGAPAAVKTSLGSPSSGRTSNNAVVVQKEGGNVANNSTYSDLGVITTTGVTGQPGSGIGWKLSPNANAFANSPLRLNIGKIACPANVPTTVKYWAKLSAAGPTAQLKIFGGRYAGVGSAGTDVVSSAITGTSYAQVSLTFTPTEACVVDIFAEVWGSSTQSLTVSGPVAVSQ